MLLRLPTLIAGRLRSRLHNVESLAVSTFFLLSPAPRLIAEMPGAIDELLLHLDEEMETPGRFRINLLIVYPNIGTENFLVALARRVLRPRLSHSITPLPPVVWGGSQTSEVGGVDWEWRPALFNIERSRNEARTF